jgi:hypothetical protein
MTLLADASFMVAARSRLARDGTAMRSFGLTPEQVLSRAPAAAVRPPPPLAFSVFYGAAGFAAVSLVAYSIYAYRLIQGTAAMYSTIAVIYVLLTGLVLSRLVAGPGAASRFALLFATAFVVYALAWCAFWFGLKGKYHADLWGSALGLAAMAWMLPRAFGKQDGFLTLFAVLFTFHTLGYYLGDVLHAAVRGSAGRLLWGLGHGLGFGAGIGYVLFQSQWPLRIRLNAAETARAPATP